MDPQRPIIVPAVGQGFAVLTPSLACDAFVAMPAVAFHLRLDEDPSPTHHVTGIGADGSASYVDQAALQLPDGRVLAADGLTYPDPAAWLDALRQASAAGAAAKRLRLMERAVA